MRAFYRATTFPILFVFMSVLFLSSAGTATADGWFTKENIPKIIGTIAGGVIGAVLVSTTLPTFGVLGIVGGGLLGAIIGRFAAKLITGESNFESVSDLVRDSWDATKERASDVGGWFSDRYDGVKDYFDDKFGKPDVANAPTSTGADVDLGKLRSEFIEATVKMQKAMSARDRKAQEQARADYEKAYHAYFSARGKVGK